MPRPRAHGGPPTRGPGRTIRAAIALAAVVTWALGCAEVLSVPEETESVAADFCKCTGDEDLTGAWPGETCVAHVEGRLATAEPEVRSAWLALYAEQDCGNCKNHDGRAACKAAAPVCAATGASCIDTSTCCVPPGAEVYCGAQDVCVIEQNCTPPFEACDPAAPNCCGQAGFKGGCVGDTPETAYCLETCDPAAPVNCPGCCAFFGQSVGGSTTSQYLCVPESDCDDACDPGHGDDCGGGLSCTPTVQIVQDTTYTVDACLEACDPDAPDTCSSGCCVRFRDLTTMTEVGRCVAQGQGICNQRCRVRDAGGALESCSIGPIGCNAYDLPVGPAGPFQVFLCN